MKYVFKDISNIKDKIEKQRFVLLLDFDLTLSPLARNPKHAFLPKTTKDNLKKIAPWIPVVIITGRKLNDIKKRVNIKGILYVGNHGLEHDLNKKHTVTVAYIPISIKKALLRIKEELIEKCRVYTGIVFEDKKYAFALGYRSVRKNNILPLESIFKKIEKDIESKGLLETRLEKKTFELRPRVGINKGTACRLILKVIQNRLRKKVVPIYIGDGETDEDAFAVLRGNGITIRVGENKKSAAKWYVHNPQEVNLFLKWLFRCFIARQNNQKYLKWLEKFRLRSRTSAHGFS